MWTTRRLKTPCPQKWLLDIDATNINVSKYAEKLGTGSVAEGEKNLVNGETVFNAIKDLKGTTDTNLTTKVDVNMTNISSEGKTVIKGLAQDAVKVTSGTNSHVTSTTDKEGNLTYTVDVLRKHWIRKPMLTWITSLMQACRRLKIL